MKTKLFKHTTLCFIALSVVSTIFSQEANFQGLGYIYEPSFFPFSEAHGVSDDGSVIVGISTSIYEENEVSEAFRWTEAEGMVGLGNFLYEIDYFSWARGISADGSVIIGYANTDPFSGLWEATRWTEQGIESLGDLGSIDFWSEATDISADGSVIVGRSYSTNEAFRWENGEMERLAEEGTVAEAWGISADGSVIVGTAYLNSVQQAFRWTEEEGMIGLGAPEDGDSVAFKVSSNGVIVGSQWNPETDSLEAFRWTEEGGMVGLGDLSGGSDRSEANDLSNDGSVIVGISNSSNGWEAFYWTEENGMQSLQEVLENDYGLDLKGWTLTTANAVSGDGSTIVGTGMNPDGNPEAFRVTLPAPLSVNDFAEIGINLYPNPTTGIVNIQTTGVVENAKVYDITGKTLPLIHSKGEKVINLSHFSSGIYFVKITVDGQTSRHKIIKQ